MRIKYMYFTKKKDGSRNYHTDECTWIHDMDAFGRKSYCILNHDRITDTARRTSKRVHPRGTFVRFLSCSDKAFKKRM